MYGVFKLSSYMRQYLYGLLMATCIGLPSAFIAACSSQSKRLSADEQAEQLTFALENGGYKIARSFEIASSSDVWIHDQAQLIVEMMTPVESGSYPLIIYLPGLGEDAKAGRIWRENWAKAGYAVFSIQPAEISQALKGLSKHRATNDDESLDLADESPDKDSEIKHGRSSSTARTSELHYAGHEYFSTDSLKSRMQHLFWAYQQLKVRTTIKQPPYARADLSKVILAGYDLGAQTTTAVLGEHFKEDLPSNSELKPLAAIVLSPSVNLAEGNPRNRFQNLTLPMLVITGIGDNDPYAITSDTARTTVWADSPPGSKYLLSLRNSGHRLLSGSANDGGASHRSSGWFGNFESRSQDDAVGDSEKLAYGSHSGGHGRNRSGGGERMGGHRGMDTNSDELAIKHLAAVVSMSLAFLDTIVNHDEFAQLWIESKANDWLNKAGTVSLR